MNFLQDLRRRHVFRVLGLYIVGAWLIIQVASTFFPAWNIPDTALRYLIYAAVLGFPVAGVFGWSYDITEHGIVRTSSSGATGDLSLQRTDYVLLGALLAVALAVIYGSIVKVQESADGIDFTSIKLPNSIAVLPFESLNTDQDIAYFSDGVAEEILHRLSGFEALNVLGRASSFAFRGSDFSISRISDILRVRYVLQGSVRREANQVRVTASLLDESGFQVWSDTFDRELEGIFSIQSDIANDVARQLNRELVPQALRVAETTSVTDAYDEYLIGRAHAHERAPGWALKAAAAYERAIEMDQTFAAPYAGLAITTLLGSTALPEDNDLRRATAQNYIDSALAVDFLLPDAHAAQGLMLITGREPDHEAAEEALRKAIDLDPNYMNAYNWLSIALNGQQRFEESREIQERALTIDPLNPIISANMSNHYFAIGDFHRARALWLRLLELPQAPGTVIISLYNLHDEFGKLVEANHWAKRRIREYLPVGETWCLSELGNNYRYLGNDAEADYWYAKSIANEPQGLRTFVRRTYLQKLSGDTAGFKALLEEYDLAGDVDASRLPGFIAQVIGAVKIMSGDEAGGIRIIEEVVDLDSPLANAAGGDINAMDFLHLAAHAYRAIGNETRADELLLRAADYVQTVVELGEGKHPKFMELQTLNLAMRGRTEEAIEVFDAAVDTGWRNYLFILHDPRWQELLNEPAMQLSMAMVKADLDRQRLQVEKIDAEEDFRAEVDMILAASSQSYSP